MHSQGRFSIAVGFKLLFCWLTLIGSHTEVTYIQKESTFNILRYTKRLTAYCSVMTRPVLLLVRTTEDNSEAPVKLVYRFRDKISRSVLTQVLSERLSIYSFDDVMFSNLLIALLLRMCKLEMKWKRSPKV